LTTVNHRDTETQRDSLSAQVIGAAIEAHRGLGPGLLESAYEQCLCYELSSQGLGFERQVALPITYKQVNLDCGYRLDIVVGEKLLVEIKAVEKLLPVHQAQLLTYLKASKLPTGLLINFNVPVLKQGIKRMRL
jgi:GxxExxY protein